jgi:hypothetical protein
MRENIAQGHAVSHFSQNAVDEAPWRPAANQTPARQRIALVGPSGASLAVALGDFIREMQAHGHEVICFAPALDNQSLRLFNRMGVQALPLPAFRQGFSPVADPRNVLRLSRFFHQMKPDIVAGYSPKGAALAAMAGRIARVGHVVSLLAELGRGFAEAPERSSAAARQFQKSVLKVAFKPSRWRSSSVTPPFSSMRKTTRSSSAIRSCRADCGSFRSMAAASICASSPRCRCRRWTRA